MDKDIPDKVGIVRNQVAGVRAEGRDQTVPTYGRPLASRIAFLTGSPLADPHRSTGYTVTHEDILIREETGLLRREVRGFRRECHKLAVGAHAGGRTAPIPSGPVA